MKENLVYCRYSFPFAPLSVVLQKRGLTVLQPSSGMEEYLQANREEPAQLRGLNFKRQVNFLVHGRLPPPLSWSPSLSEGGNRDTKMPPKHTVLKNCNL